MTATDDDPNLDWEGEGGATVDEGTILLAIEPDTAPHPVEMLPGFEPGRVRGRSERSEVVFSEGQVDALTAVRLEMLARGLTEDEVANFLRAAGQRLTVL